MVVRKSGLKLVLRNYRLIQDYHIMMARNSAQSNDDKNHGRVEDEEIHHKIVPKRANMK
jgi:hypothetical protein